MAQKKITDLQLIAAVTSDLNFLADNGIQTYRTTSLQIREYVANYILGPRIIPASALQTGIYVNPNHIINGNFDHWQRGTSSSVSSSRCVADRFIDLVQGATGTASRQTALLTEGFNANYFKRTLVNSVTGAMNFYLNTQRIEDVVKLSGKTVTLSFWAKADTSRNIAVEFSQNFGTGGSPSAEVTGLGVEKFALTTSWQKFTKTVTLPSVSGKTLGTSGNNYTGVSFWFDAGSGFNPRTDSLGHQSGTFDLAQIKLEEGSEATGFVLHGGSIDSDLASCQRFYQSHSIILNSGYSRNFLGGIWILPVKMRASPSFSCTDAVGNLNRISSPAGHNIPFSAGAPSASNQQIGIDAISSTTSDTWWRFDVYLDAEI